MFKPYTMFDLSNLSTDGLRNVYKKKKKKKKKKSTCAWILQLKTILMSSLIEIWLCFAPNFINK